MDGAVWRDPEHVQEWVGELSKSDPVIVFCAYGFHVGCKTAIAQRGLDQRRTLVDLCAVPARSVLLLEQHDLAGPIEAARAPRVVQQHEREQSLRLGVSQQQLDQHAPEPNRLLAQFTS